MVEEAERLVQQAAKEAEGVESTLFNMDADERALLEVGAALLKLERYFHGRSRGFSIRIVRGVTYRVGEMIGRRERDEAWSVADAGYFTVTNKRVVLRGDEEIVDIPLRSIVGLDELSDDELAIQSKRRNTVRFSFAGNAHEVATRMAEAAGK